MFSKIQFALFVFLALVLLGAKPAAAAVEEPTFVFRVLQYGGGGDWYEGKVGAIELLKFVNSHSFITAAAQPQVVTLKGYNLFAAPFLYVTGHGNWLLTPLEVKQLRAFLTRGGLLFINDDYGMNLPIRRELKKVFPKRKLVPLPLSHPLFHLHYSFPEGAPKVHKHDGGAPEVYAIFENQKIAVLYTKNTDIGDGWAPYQVHKNPPAVRQRALEFGFNVVLYSLVK